MMMRELDEVDSTRSLVEDKNQNHLQNSQDLMGKATAHAHKEVMTIFPKNQSTSGQAMA